MIQPFLSVFTKVHMLYVVKQISLMR